MDSQLEYKKVNVIYSGIGSVMLYHGLLTEGYL